MCKERMRAKRVAEEFPEKYPKHFSFMDASVILEQPSREMIVVEELSQRKRRNR